MYCIMHISYHEVTLLINVQRQDEPNMTRKAKRRMSNDYISDILVMEASITQCLYLKLWYISR